MHGSFESDHPSRPSATASLGALTSCSTTNTLLPPRLKPKPNAWSCGWLHFQSSNVKGARDAVLPAAPAGRGPRPTPAQGAHRWLTCRTALKQVWRTYVRTTPRVNPPLRLEQERCPL